ncbi:MAG: dTMP kinase [Candidatus Diapherotrites archaeon]|nr:dTMP kinase [Candidatus Diapherotrites archaeon]
MGCFIVFEGIDGCGKGTMLSLAAKWLFSMEFDNILLTREPTYSGIGKQIRSILKSDTNPIEKAKIMLSLYIEDRKEHVEKVIKPALRLNSIILCDRYKYSTMCYQHAQGIPIEKIIVAHKRMLVPDLVLVLDVDVEIAMARMSLERKKKEKFEHRDFLKEIRETYLEIPKLLPDENIKVIDANRSTDEVFDSVKREISKVLKD